jgi:hypothetical protein
MSLRVSKHWSANDDDRNDQATKGNTAMNLSARLDKLERTDSIGCCVVIWQNHGEPAEAAIDRWRAAHPGEPEANRSNVTLIRWEAPQ